MTPEIFNIGNFSVRWYSILILLGIIVAYLLANKESKKFKIPKDFVFDLVFWVVIVGIISARLYYVIFNFSSYSDNILNIFKVWQGGLAIHGGIIGGLITLIIYCKIKNVNPFRMMDIAVPSLIIAQAIGRWGNFFNGEAHGPETTLVNLQNMHLPEFIVDGMNIDGIYYHPTFLYESLWCVLGFLLLLLIRRYYKCLKIGQLTSFYLIWYGTGRLFIESLRTDSLMLGSLKVAQIISIFMIIIGLLIFIYLCFNPLKKGKYYNKNDMV
jgi:phosphatidylglycerol:prolipoprotein diacylglycerol transferase